MAELDGEEIWHADGTINSAELTIWSSRVTILVADDGTVNRLRQPHRVVARLVDGSDEIAVQVLKSIDFHLVNAMGTDF